MNNSTDPTVVYFEEGSDSKLPITAVVTILSFLSFGTVIGNSLVFTAILINPALHSVTYLSVFSLAIADFLAGIIAMPSYILKKFSLGKSTDVIVCDVFRFSYFLTGYASILSLSVISVERLLAVKSPLRYTTVVTHKRVIAGLILASLDAIIISSLPFVPWDPNSPYKECNYEPTRWWSIMVIISNVIFPFLLIVTCYTYMYLTARSHIKKILSNRNCVGNDKARSPRRQSNERRASTTILIVIGVFVASWFPSCFYYFLQKTCPQCFSDSFRSKQSIFNALVKMLTFTSSFANPIIYSWRSRHFRNAFYNILTKISGRVSRAQRTDTITEIFRPRGSTIGSGCIKEACNIFSSKMDVGTYVVTLDTQRPHLERDNCLRDEQI